MRKAMVLGGVLVALCVGVGSPAMAHHAVQSQFDVTKNMIITGKLTKIDWQNPHAWFHFDVTLPDGKVEEWATETVGPNSLRRIGLSDRRLFKIGDVYKVDICPDRSGKHLGFTNSFTFPDGKFVKVGFPENPNGEVP